METTVFLFFFSIFSKFKSYYVVWKLHITESKNNTQASLNRTMQYGNGRYPTPMIIKCIWFKSYYVVWKPLPNRFFPFPEGKFKSYYVVWKPQLLPVSLHMLTQFKSYYVVWKLRLATQQGRICSCLNRTMQYGNYPSF